jgi:putative endonuclease
MYRTYILQCSDGSFYVGSSVNLQDRVQTHNAGDGPTFTAKRLPVRLVYSEEHPMLEAALKRERQIKRWSHAKKVALVLGDKGRLKALSRCHGQLTE